MVSFNQFCDKARHCLFDLTEAFDVISENELFNLVSLTTIEQEDLSPNRVHFMCVYSSQTTVSIV